MFGTLCCHAAIYATCRPRNLRIHHVFTHRSSSSKTVKKTKKEKRKRKKIPDSSRALAPPANRQAVMLPFSKQHDKTPSSSSSPVYIKPRPSTSTSPSPSHLTHQSPLLSPLSSSTSSHYLYYQRIGMGLCLSSGVAAAMAEAGMAASTAMVLLPTGELREYPRPATAARVLEDVAAAEGEEEDVGRRFFLCDADKMGFEGPVAAVAAAAELRPGRSTSCSRARCGGADAPRGGRGARRQASAALAAASSSSTTSGCGGGRRRRGSVAPLVFAPPEEDTSTTRLITARAMRRRRRRRRGSGGRWRRAAARKGGSSLPISPPFPNST